MKRKKEWDGTSNGTIRGADNLLSLHLMDLLEIDETGMGSQTNTNAAVLTVNTKSFLPMIKENNNAEQVFFQVNEILNSLIPVVLKNQGVIDHFIGGGLCALYMDSCEAALHTAIEMGENMAKWKSYAIGIAYGSIMIGMVGNKQAFSMVTVSEYTGLSEYLQSIAQEYYSQMLISGTFADQVEGFFERYEYRFLGYLYIKSMNKLEKIYDVPGVNKKIGRASCRERV